MNRIAGQSVLAGQRGNAAVLEAAEPALGGGPERTFAIESKVVDAPLAKPVGGCVRRADLTVLIMHHAALHESDP